jgi:hypothetical protein
MRLFYRQYAKFGNENVVVTSNGLFGRLDTHYSTPTKKHSKHFSAHFALKKVGIFSYPHRKKNHNTKKQKTLHTK